MQINITLYLQRIPPPLSLSLSQYMRKSRVPYCPRDKICTVAPNICGFSKWRSLHARLCARARARTHTHKPNSVVTR